MDNIAQMLVNLIPLNVTFDKMGYTEKACITNMQNMISIVKFSLN